MVFDCYFLPLAEAHGKLEDLQDEFLHLVRRGGVQQETCSPPAVAVRVHTPARAGGASITMPAANILMRTELRPQIRPDRLVSGDAVTVTHEHKSPSDERSAEIYQRREFVETLKVPVIATRQLFEWWRYADWQAIGSAVLSRREPATSPTDLRAATDAPTGDGKHRWPWRR